MLDRQYKERLKRGKACARCGKFALLTVDHIIPRSLLSKFLSLDWGDKEQNLQVLCEPCNKIKGGDLDYTNPKTIPLLRQLIDRVEWLHVNPKPRRKYVWRILTVKSMAPPTYWHSEKKHQEALKKIYERQQGKVNAHGILIS